MAWTTLGTVAPGDVLRANSGTAAYNNVIGNLNVLRALANVEQHLLTSASGPTNVVTGTESANILSVSITPTAATSKVLVTCNLHATFDGALAFAILYRGATAIGIGDAAGSRRRVTATSTPGDSTWNSRITFTILDTNPNTTSAITYAVKLRHWSSIDRNLYVNRTVTDSDSGLYSRTVSTLTVQEIPA